MIPPQSFVYKASVQVIGDFSGPLYERWVNATGFAGRNAAIAGFESSHGRKIGGKGPLGRYGRPNGHAVSAAETDRCLEYF